MKAFLIVCILLASILIVPSTITARELVPKEENSGHKHEDIISKESFTDATGGGSRTGGTGGKNTPATNCGRGKPYKPCKGKPKPPPSSVP